MLFLNQGRRAATRRPALDPMPQEMVAVVGRKRFHGLLAACRS